MTPPFRLGFFPRAIVLLPLMLVSFAAPVLAQGETPSAENTPAGWIFRWIIFAIVLVALIKFFAGSAPALRARSEEVAEKIAEGARAREAAERARREVQAKLAGIDAEVAKLRAEAKKSMEAEAARLKALARREAEIIEHAAQAEIVAAQRAVALELKSFAARLAIERAAAMLAQQMTPERQASLFQTFVLELERSAN